MTLTATEWAPLDEDTDRHNCRPPSCPGVHVDGGGACRIAPFLCECGRSWVPQGAGHIPAKNAPRPNGRTSPKGTRPQGKKKGRRR